MTKRYGLVFKFNDDCWISEYIDGEIQEAYLLSDEEGVYDELNPREMAIVEIVHEKSAENGEVVSLADVRTITVRCDDEPENTVMDLIKAGALPELARAVFENEDLD